MPTSPVDLEPAARPGKLVLDKVRKVFRTGRGDVTALEDVSLNVGEGEFVCLVGASGCGKSTLLNLVAGLDKPDGGSVLVDGAPVVGPGRDRMVMFQESALFPWLDVRGNVLFGLALKPGLSRSDRREVAAFYLQMVGLTAFERASIHELSGGMKQRVALARALAPNPRVLLMDEPFGALDAMTREQLYADIQRIWAQRRKTILFVTHDVREAVCLGDRVVLLSPHPGRVEREFQVSAPRPRDPYAPEVTSLAAAITESLRMVLASSGPAGGR